ncbi:MAG TPA: hemolysin family protein [Tepidisphaeraceae bacterium]|nr:hemolysin family protein [Tepidisphaeraceae bacterium]
MTLGLTLALSGVVLTALLSLMFSTLTYSLRDFSRTKLEDYFKRHNRAQWYEKTVAVHEDLIFVTAIGRLLANIMILVAVLHLASSAGVPSEWTQYLIAIVVTGIVTLFCSVAVPHALSQHAAERFIGSHARFLHLWRLLLLPAARMMHAIDRAVGMVIGVRRGTPAEEAEQTLQEEILSVVEEGEKEGVVDEQEREMIESVIQFRDTHAGQVMTARPEIIALPIASTFQKVKETLDESGLSRIPIYEDSLDHIIGILYARDLLKQLGLRPEEFDIRTAMRPAFYVPETKSLRDLLSDFRAKKVHMAIVLDEYGATTGLVTIEDVLEELVGELADEHEPQEPKLYKRIDDKTFEADARVRIDELNRELPLNLPEDAGYETLGGFLSNTLGRIPQAGVRHEHAGIRLIVLEAEPQRINRVRIELLAQNAPEPRMV